MKTHITPIEWGPRVYKKFRKTVIHFLRNITFCVRVFIG